MNIPGLGSVVTTLQWNTGCAYALLGLTAAFGTLALMIVFVPPAGAVLAGSIFALGSGISADYSFGSSCVSNEYN